MAEPDSVTAISSVCGQTIISETDDVGKRVPKINFLRIAVTISGLPITICQQAFSGYVVYVEVVANTAST